MSPLVRFFFPLFFTLFNVFVGKAQLLLNGKVFSGIGSQRVVHVSIDKKGNQYAVVAYDSTFAIDSISVPVMIRQPDTPKFNRNSLAILKFDSNGRYLRHVRFHAMVPSSYTPTLTFDSNNDAYLYFNHSLSDTIQVIDAFKNIRFLIQRNINRSNINWISATICKINENGQLSWVNYLSYPDSLQQGIIGKISIFNACQLNINNVDEITVHAFRILPVNNLLPDTLHITHSNGLITKMLVTTEDILVKFTPNGNLVYGVEPFKNRLQPQTDAITNRIYKAVTDGRYTYSINRFYLSTNDTFRCRTPVPMEVGQNFLLIKCDERDSIVWAKWIGRGDAYRFSLDYNPVTSELALGFTCLPYDFVSPFNPYYLTSRFYDILLLRIDTSGSVKWSKMYSGNDVDELNALSYNQLNNQLLLIGNTTSTNLQLDSYSVPKVASLTYFIASLDSTNTISSVQSIQSNSFNLPRFNAILGLPITDRKGRTFIPGWFSDSIVLPCRTLQSQTQTIDGVLLVYNTLITIDTGVCDKMISPSGKYTWDSAGVYRDTLLNTLGCDSLLQFKVTVLRNNMTLDSSVCYRMVSYSGRYVWDSSGTYLDTLVNSKGCDSIIKVRLTVLRSKSAIETSSCGVLKSPSNRYFYDSSGTYFDTIPNSKGCDSIMQIRVTINNTRNSIDTSYCGSYLSPSGKLYISQTGIYNDTIPNTNGCDSIITIRFTKTNLKDTVSISDCKSYQSPSGKYIFSLSGQYTDTLQSVFNCDSILFINYVRLSTQSLITRTICDTLLSPSGKYVYSASGFYQDTVTSYLGCDSVITINLIVKPIQLTVSKSNDISCDSLFSTLQATTGYSYVWSPKNTLNDVTISNPRATPSTNTIYYVIVSDSLGCTKMDSVEVFVNKEETIEQLSNVFTPNDDGINDCLMLKGVGELKQVDLTIYNRWGARVFSTNKPDDCWDGRINDQEAPAGTYFFVLNGVSICETLISQHGSVQLIR